MVVLVVCFAGVYVLSMLSLLLVKPLMILMANCTSYCSVHVRGVIIAT